MRELVEQIARVLVDYPDAVEVTEVQGTEAVVLELRTHPEDTGRVIGRNGRTVRAIRTILAAAGAKTGKRFTLDVISEESPQPPQRESRARSNPPKDFPRRPH